MRVRLDERIRDRIVAETHGNPMALLELPWGLTATQLAGGFGLVEAQGLAGRIEESFVRRVETLSDDARRLLLVAAAEPVGDPLLLLAASERLGIAASAVDAETDGLLTLGERVTFRHPLVRSAVYRTATKRQRREVHLALADATDRSVDPDRRAWHLATAAGGPNETVAVALEQSAGRAQARGGLAAAAAFLRRSVVLSRDREQRVRRALAAAQASLHAGIFEGAIELLTLAEASRPDELQMAHVELLRGQVAFASSMGTTAPRLLVRAARRLERLDPELARETYLDAWGAALFAGRFATAGSLVEVSRAARSAPRPADPVRPSDLLLDGVTTFVTEGHAAAAALLRRATAAFAHEASPSQENFRWGWMTTIPPDILWDEESWHAISARHLEEARDAGALGRLSIDLADWGIFLAWCGDFRGAAVAIAEAEEITKATGTHIAPYAQLLLSALRGQSDALPLIEATIRDAGTGGQGLSVQWAEWASAVLFDGLGRYDRALASAQRAVAETPHLHGMIRDRHYGEGRYESSERLIQRLLGVERPLVPAEGLGVEAAADWDHLQTPETYLGYARGAHFASPQRPAGDERREYALPDDLPLNHWALAGEWTIGAENVVLDRAGGSIAFRFHARDAHLVVSRAAGEAIPFRVHLDGETPGRSAGVDVDEDGNGVLRDGRMYQLVRQHDEVRDRTLAITFLEPRGGVFVHVRLSGGQGPAEPLVSGW